MTSGWQDGWQQPEKPAPRVGDDGGEAVAVVLRVLVAALILGSWLLLLTSWQVALYPTGETLPTARMPAGAVLVAMGAAVLVRVRWPSTLTHLLALTILVGGVAALAANPGSPLPSAVRDQCGASCRDAILGRLISFYGWPILVFGALACWARIEYNSTESGELGRWTWTAAWAIAALVLGMLVAFQWWRIILPEG